MVAAQKIAPASGRAQPVPASQLPHAAFATPLTVRFTHCDPAGIVFTPRWVDLMNTALETFFPSIGFDYYSLIRDDRLGLGYAQIHCEFFRPGLMGDEIAFTVLIGRVGAGSVAFRVHGHRDGEELVRGDFVLVTTDLNRHKAIPIPDALRAAFLAYQDQCQ
jgi:4-hydroxybenzoyl-CoA thioesterase